MNNALKYGYEYLCVLLLLLSGACSSKYDSDNSALSNQKVENVKHEKNGLNGAGLNKIPIKGKVINLDTMLAPKVVRAGKPRVVPFNDFTIDVKYPKTLSIPEKQVIIVPGKDSFPAASPAPRPP